ncbi:putative transposase [Colletotrichum sublineola]|uniref:Putative transposase n=1 Tax=Colletotrichum sublineola TaxID=1173701 RepID=A0A066WXZ4_COLSU|nr:putative transposase [Colletotrichum sublineola]
MPRQCDKHMTPAKKAAQLLFAAQQQAGRDRPGKKASAVPTIRQLARDYGVSDMSIRRHLQTLRRGGNLRASPEEGGRPRSLTDAEDTALGAFVIWLDQAGFPALPLQVEETANFLRNLRGLPPVSVHFVRSWLADHPELEARGTIKPVEVLRRGAELDPVPIEDFFTRLRGVVRDYDLGPSDIWNADESGCRIGCINGQVHVIVLKRPRHCRQPEVIDPANRESCTVVGCGNAIGDSIPVYMIFKAWPVTAWVDYQIQERVRFAHSTTGFSSQEVMMDYIRHFNTESYEYSAKYRRMGHLFGDYFGIDAYGCGSYTFEYNLPNGQSTTGCRPYHNYRHTMELLKRPYRLLLLDGFSGHVSLVLMEYCIRYDIILGFFPAHITHILQPMDVGVFQPFKKAQQQVLRNHIRDGNLMFTRGDFVSSLRTMTNAAFTKRNIMNGFEKAGIWPIRDDIILARLVRKIQESKAEIPSRLICFLPDEDRFNKAMITAEYIEEKYGQQWSPHSKKGYKMLKQVISEGALTHKYGLQHIHDRNTRLSTLQRKKQARRGVKPSQSFVTSVTIADIREAREKQIAEATQAEQRQQKAIIKRLTREDEKKVRAKYSATKYQLVDGYMKRLSFKQWLDHTGEGQNYIPFEASDSRWHEEKAPNFTIDVNPAPHPQHILNRFKYTARPLSQVDVNQALADAAREAAGLDFDPDDFENIDDPIEEDNNKPASGDESVDIPGHDDDDDEVLSLQPSPSTQLIQETTSQAPQQYKSKYHSIKAQINNWRSTGIVDNNPHTPPLTQPKRKQQHMVYDGSSDSSVAILL